MSAENFDLSKLTTFNQIQKFADENNNLVDLMAGLIFSDICENPPGDFQNWMFNELGPLYDLPSIPTLIQDIYVAAAKAHNYKLISACLLEHVALIYDKNKNFQKAHESYQEALDILENWDKPIDEKWMNQAKGKFSNSFAWSLYQARKFEEGIKWAKKGLDVLPDYANLKGTLGTLLYHSSDPVEREQAFGFLEQFMSQGLNPEPNEDLAQDPKYIALANKYLGKK